MTRLFLIAVLSALPSSVLAQCEERAHLNPCELALYESLVTLDGEKKQSEELLGACEAKLETRTTTVIRTLVEPCPVAEPQTVITWAIITGLSGIIAGFLFGMFGG